MKLLREYIRELLKESVDPKIMSMIDRAEAAGYKVRLFVVPKEGGSVRLVEPSDKPLRLDGKNAIGSVEWRKPKFSDHGNCLGGQSVGWSESDGGFGPLLYDVAIEASGGLMPDRFDVSGEAEAVWDRYMNSRSDVTVRQLDILPDYEEPQITPDDPNDDCSQVPAHDMLKDKWHTSPLSKIYSKSGTPVIDELIKRGMLIDNRTV